MDTASAALRAIHIVFVISAGGAVLFPVLVLGPAFAAAGDAVGNQLVLARRQLDLSLARLALASLAAAVATGVGWVLCVAAGIINGGFAGIVSRETGEILLSTQFGNIQLARLAAAIVLALALRGSAEICKRLAAASALALLASLTLSSHLASVPGGLGVILTLSGTAHVVAAGVWVGSLLPLAVLLARLEGIDATAGSAVAANSVSRFGMLGVFAVATLLVSGTLDAWHTLAGASVLQSSAYAEVLRLKLGAAMLLLMIAAFNRWWLTPRLALPGGIGRLRHSVWCEVFVGLLVLLAAGTLGQLQPPASGAAAHVH